MKLVARTQPECKCASNLMVYQCFQLSQSLYCFHSSEHVRHYVDVYYDFCFEPMRNLLLEMSCLPRECMRSMLNNDSRDSSAVKTAAENHRSF